MLIVILLNKNNQKKRKKKSYLPVLLASKLALLIKESGTFLSQMIIQYVNDNILKKFVSKPMGTYKNEPVKKTSIFPKLASNFARFLKFQVSMYSVLEKPFGCKIWAWYNLFKDRYHKKSLLALFKNVTN